MNAQEVWFLYAHIVPTSVSGYDHDKMYVGITKREPMTRWGAGGSGYKKHPRFWNAIQKYGWDNIKHRILAEGITHEMACKAEKRLIELFKTHDKKYGYNISPGGVGGNVTGKVTAVCQYNRDGTLIKVWNSASDAARELDCHRTRITHAARNGGLCYGFQWRYAENYSLIIPPYKRATQKTVYQFDLDGNYIKKYLTLHDAAEQSGLNGDNILRCIRGRNHTAGGYLWSYDPKGGAHASSK